MQALRVGRDELRRVRRGRPSPDPPLRIAVGARPGMLLTIHEGTMGGQQGRLVQVGGQPGSSPHGLHVRRHERCVGAGAFAKSRQGEGSRARGDVLDLRGGRGLGAQKHRVDRRDLSSEPREGVADLGVEAHDGGRRLLDLGRQIGGQVEPESGDTGWERSSIRARRAHASAPSEDAGVIRVRGPGTLFPADGRADGLIRAHKGILRNDMDQSLRRSHRCARTLLSRAIASARAVEHTATSPGARSALRAAPRAVRGDPPPSCL